MPGDHLIKEIKNTTRHCLNFGGHMLPETRGEKISHLTRKFLFEHSQGQRATFFFTLRAFEVYTFFLHVL